MLFRSKRDVMARLRLCSLLMVWLVVARAHAQDMGAPDMSAPPCTPGACQPPSPITGLPLSPVAPYIAPVPGKSKEDPNQTGTYKCPDGYPLDCNLAKPNAPGVCCPAGSTCDGQGGCGGGGLCVAYALNVISSPLTAGGTQTYCAVNNWFDGRLGGGRPVCAPVSAQSLTSEWSQIDGVSGSTSDFISKNMGGCAGGGCQFPLSTSFHGYVVRYRGFLDIPKEWANKRVHFGVSAGPAAELVIYDGMTGYILVALPPDTIGLSNNNYHGTSTVVFSSAGLYPIEANFFSQGPGGEIEVSVNPVSETSFSDITVPEIITPANATLSQSGFKLLSAGSFFQSARGRITTPPAGAAGTCNQCPRKFAGSTDIGPKVGCPDGYFCNEAAICEACNTDAHCAGNSCNCCAPGTRCVFDSEGTQNFICAQCLNDSGCSAEKYCDKSTHACVDKPATGAAGPAEQACSPSAPLKANGCQDKDRRPFCLGGAVCVECRDDLDCQATLPGHYCLSGQCVECKTDRRCGPNCLSCGEDRPFCVSGGAQPRCARCYQDSQCPGSECSRDQECTKPSTMTCASPTPYAFGDRCVECYASSQCPCGKECVDNQCQVFKCSEAAQCNGDQCCDTTSGECYAGTCSAVGPAPCCSAGQLGAPGFSGHAAPDPLERQQAAARAALVLLLVLVLPAGTLWRRRRRPDAGPGKDAS